MGETTGVVEFIWNQMHVAVILVAVLFLVFVVGGIWLQIFLSKQESKWPGLILPILSFGIALTAFLGILVFSAHTGTLELVEDGRVIEQTVETIAEPVSIFASAIYIFVLHNIPTAVLLIIYAACRDRRRKQRALEKMSMQDLG